MRQIREILRQKWTLGRTHRQVAEALRVGLGGRFVTPQPAAPGDRVLSAATQKTSSGLFLNSFFPSGRQPTRLASAATIGT
jgi:hypothetical protein